MGRLLIRVDVSSSGMPYYADKFGIVRKQLRSSFDQLQQSESLKPIDPPSDRRGLSGQFGVDAAEVLEVSFGPDHDSNADRLRNLLCAINWAAPECRAVIAFVNSSDVFLAFLYPIAVQHENNTLFPERISPKTEKTLSVCLATYNRASVLAECLRALDRSYLRLAEQYPALKSQFEVVIVDDGSTDETCSVVESVVVGFPLTFERITNSGPAKARTLAICKARGKVIIVIDDDKIVHEDFLLCHHKHHMARPSTYEMAVGMVGWHGQTNFLMRHIVSRKGGELFPFDMVSRRIRNNLPSTFFITANVSFKKELFSVVGGFNCEIFRDAMWEDTELGWRMAMCGARLRYLPGAVNYHDHPMTLPSFAARQYKVGGYIYRLGKLPFMREHRANPKLLDNMPLASILHNEYSISALNELCAILAADENTAKQQCSDDWLHYIYRQLLFTCLLKGAIGEEDRPCSPRMPPLELANFLLLNPPRYDFAVLRYLPEGADSRSINYWLADDRERFGQLCTLQGPQIISKLQFEPTKCRTSQFRAVNIELIMEDGNSKSISSRSIRHNGREKKRGISFRKPARVETVGKFGPAVAIKISAERENSGDRSVVDEVLGRKPRHLWRRLRHRLTPIVCRFRRL